MPLLSRSNYLYQARIYDNSSNLIGLYDDLISIYYKKTVNQIGMAVLTVPDTHAILDQLVDDLLLEVFFIYRPASVGEVTDQKDFLGLYRDKQAATDRDGNTYYLLYFVGANDILSRNIIDYTPGTNNKSQWTGATGSIVASNVVNYNCTSNATISNGRKRDASVIWNLTAGTAVIGATINYAAAYRNVLETVRELATNGGFDFDVVRPSLTSTNLEFTLYAGHLGSDKHTTIIFDLNLDNIAAANQNGGRLQEKTVAIVGGAGDGAARTIIAVTGTNQSASNDYEIFVDARSSTASELADIGDSKMAELAAKTNIDVDIAPSGGYVYRRDYVLGDLVTASFDGSMVTKKINTVEVKFDQDQNTTIRIELINP